MLKPWLSHPLTRGLEIDDPSTTAIRQQIIKQKFLLRKIYQDWYRSIAEEIHDGSGAVLQLGSAAGFLREHIPDLITSDVLCCTACKRTLDGTCLPFADG